MPTDIKPLTVRRVVQPAEPGDGRFDATLIACGLKSSRRGGFLVYGGLYPDFATIVAVLGSISPRIEWRRFGPNVDNRRLDAPSVRVFRRHMQIDQTKGFFQHQRCIQSFVEAARRPKKVLVASCN